jgi:hypothetical protein
MDLFAGRILQSVSTNLDTTRPVKFKIVTAGDHIEVYLNDESSPRIDVHDNTFSDGFIGFETAQVRATFGPVSVKIGR